MKFNLSIIALLALLTAAAFFTTGCNLVPGYDSDEVERIASEREAELKEQAEKVAEIEAALEDLLPKYEQAKQQGDVEAYTALAQQIALKYRELDVGREDLEQIRHSVENTIDEFRDADGAGGYLNVILGTLMSLFGLGSVGGWLGVRKRNDALRVTATNLERVLDETQLTELKSLQRDRLSAGQAKVINKARGK